MFLIIMMLLFVGMRRSALIADGAIYNVELYEEESWVVYKYRPRSA